MTTQTPKLLTEAEWREVLIPADGAADPIIKRLRERGLIAEEPVDPLLVEALRAREAALVKAATELRDDLLMRAEIDRDGIAIVAAGHGVWCRFNEALDAALTK